MVLTFMGLKPGLTAKGQPMPQTVEEWKYLYGLAEKRMHEMKFENAKLRARLNTANQKLRSMRNGKSKTDG